MGKALPGRQPFYAHLVELRTRLFAVAGSLVVGGLIGYWLHDRVLQWLIKPLGQTLYYSSPTGGFDFMFRICLLFAVLVALPVVVYQILRFVEPLLRRRSKLMIARMVLASVLLAVAGIAFAYYVSLPAALEFLNKFSDGQIKALISTDQYFSFVMAYLMGFMLLFQLPLLLLLIHKINPLDPGDLMKHQRPVILVAFVAAAILTPTPDPMNQAVMAVPMIGLYQVSVGVVWSARRGEHRRLRKWRGAVTIPTAKEMKLIQQHLQQVAPPPSIAPVYVAPSPARVLDLRAQAVELEADQPQVSPHNVLDLRRSAAA